MNIYEELAKIADDLHGEGPEFPFDNGGTKDGWNMACRKIAEEIRSRDKSMGLASEPSSGAPWDAWWNRSYEPVETLAKKIFDAFPYDGPGEHPEWFPGGNSHMQDEARKIARDRLRPTLSGEAK